MTRDFLLSQSNLAKFSLIIKQECGIKYLLLLYLIISGYANILGKL
jgi:hypothetical protein